MKKAKQRLAGSNALKFSVTASEWKSASRRNALSVLKATHTTGEAVTGSRLNPRQAHQLIN